MNNKDLIFENKEEKEATEKVLATFKGKKINENIDTLVSDILKYAKEIDELLDKNGIDSSYLDKVSNLSETEEITLEETIDNSKLKEEVEDLIKRINTRIKLIKDSDSELNKLTSKYDIDNVNLDEELKKANLI
mgnify:FL=1